MTILPVLKAVLKKGKVECEKNFQTGPKRPLSIQTGHNKKPELTLRHYKHALQFQ